MQIGNKASIKIVNNDSVVCGSCLSAEKSDYADSIHCRLNPEPLLKHAKEFCAQGLWFVNSQVMAFKEAFSYHYSKEGK